MAVVASMPHDEDLANLGQQAAAGGASAVPVEFRPIRNRLQCAAVISLVGAAFLWAYWPTLSLLVATWQYVPDYSHGFLVVPLAAFILWARRDRLPSSGRSSVESQVSNGTGNSLFVISPAGLLLIAFSMVLRYLGARYYIDAVDAWSILPWVAGVVWLFFGRAVALWALPSILFLIFMVPLPFRAERELSLPLQLIATKLSCWTLQILGQPALSEGHVIFLNEKPLYIEEACSGLRIFMGIAALAFAYVAVVRRTWWEKAILLASFIPIALISNATRIVATGLLLQYVSGEAAQKFSHDMAGLAMIAYAAVLFALVLWYMGKLIGEVEPLEMGAVLRMERD